MRRRSRGHFPFLDGGIIDPSEVEVDVEHFDYLSKTANTSKNGYISAAYEEELLNSHPFPISAYNSGSYIFDTDVGLFLSLASHVSL